MTWRVDGDDPYGADCFIDAIGFVKFGRGYSNTMTMKLLPGQLAWFAYVVFLPPLFHLDFEYTDFSLRTNNHFNFDIFIVLQLDLAMNGDQNLKGSGCHDNEIKNYEADILACQDRIQKIELILPGDVSMNEDLGFDD